MKITYDKLIRDRIPEILDAANVRYEVETLDDAAYRRALRAKLVEEAREVQEAATSSDLAKELADLAEVVEALLAAEGVDEAEVREVQARRRAERGGFGERLMLRWTED